MAGRWLALLKSGQTATQPLESLEACYQWHDCNRFAWSQIRRLFQMCFCVKSQDSARVLSFAIDPLLNSLGRLNGRNLSRFTVPNCHRRTVRGYSQGREEDAKACRPEPLMIGFSDDSDDENPAEQRVCSICLSEARQLAGCNRRS